MKNNVLALFFLSFTSLVFAQNKEVLFTINDNPYYTDEFVRVYKKNLDLVKDDSQKDLDKYLELFLGYKLKVEKANKLGLQNDTKYQNELKSYRNQLAKSYLNDSQVTNALIEEAYERMKYEVKASHILVMVEEGALPADTLKAYNKMLDIIKRIESGEAFDALAAKFSEDPSAKENKGDLGYFSAFRMVYPFENAAYKTAVGSVSKPFRTRFGYHILKVADKRMNRGEVYVAHIMIMKPATPDAELQEKAKQTINDIYKKLQQGESFESLAGQFSEDKSTASKGGALQRFGSGQLTSQEFEDVAFGLKEKGELSQPFQSQFGWHIVKLIDRFPLQPLEELKVDIENKIKRDDRSLLITNSLAKKLRAKYVIKTDAKLLVKTKKAVTNAFYEQNWVIPSSNEFQAALVTIENNKKLTALDFLEFVSSQQKSNAKTRPIQNLTNELFEKWLDEQVITYHNDNLENEFPEFRFVMDEYRDGLLLFDLMEKEIWNKAKNDTIGLEKFRLDNIKNYQWKERMDVDIFSSTDEKVIKKAQSYLKKGKSIDFIKQKLNVNDKINVIVKSGLFENDYDVLPEFAITKTGVTKIVAKGNYFFVTNVKEIKPAQPKLLNETKGKLVSDYQQFLENNWVDELRKEFNIKINTTVFEKTKKQLQ
ncbi:peptidylprolyl isomerase [Flavobacterium tibetense]|jgi:peptidyl-prolyl cis-trans isomerase SurA|uniref:Peptidylprolyl isomerase n=1 Tax=Flavobacterium tibetense TaxID=2233533 RepID=A0A365P3T5_9FLAO|nr:peptidylprolyl isomerase [Flavobacterium tibetense]RBA29221.1 peptidylprolyl isomerase [Flavobacterium tibetense]